MTNKRKTRTWRGPGQQEIKAHRKWQREQRARHRATLAELTPEERVQLDTMIREGFEDGPPNPVQEARHLHLYLNGGDIKAQSWDTDLLTVLRDELRLWAAARSGDMTARSSVVRALG